MHSEYDYDDLRSAGGSYVSFSCHSAVVVVELLFMGWTVKKASRVALENSLAVNQWLVSLDESLLKISSVDSSLTESLCKILIPGESLLLDVDNMNIRDDTINHGS